ncbi:MAG: DUF3667 domain-containing protein [Alphaproteobacteria bacterium]|nr:DUF3667 domain-containing protein [Alphaproteobacteria bacterium]
MSVLPACANCNTALQGPYCWNCGQKASDYHRPFWWILGEFMDAVFSFDSRTFRTLWLLFGEPGEFTRRYNAGQRASMLPPFRLFVIASFLFFLALQITGLALVAFQTKIVNIDNLPPAAQAAIRNHKGEGAFITSTDGKTISTVQIDFFVPIKPGETRALTPEQKAQLNKNAAALQKQETATASPDEADIMKLIGGYGQRVLAGFEKAMEDPLKLNGPLDTWLPRVMLFLVPVFALLLALVHWRPRVYYVEHLIFALHLHTVLFFALTVVVLVVAYFGGVGFLDAAVWPILFVYFLMAMKRVYNRGWFLTTVKAVGVLMVYSTILTMTLGLALVQALSEL